MAKMSNSNVPNLSDLALTISVLPAAVPAITELPADQSKHMGHSVDLRISRVIIMSSAKELAQPIYGKSFIKQRNKQTKDLYNGVEFYFLFFSQHTY